MTTAGHLMSFGYARNITPKDMLSFAGKSGSQNFNPPQPDMETALESWQRRDGETFLEEERTAQAIRCGSRDDAMLTRTELALLKFKDAPVLPSLTNEEFTAWVVKLRRKPDHET